MSKQSSNDVQKLRTKINELTATQKRVDTILDRMPSGPEKTRLMKLRGDNRGFFSSFILPAWNKISSTISSAMSGDNVHLGVLPLIPVIAWGASIAGGLSAAALLTHVVNNAVVENRILNDPAMKATEKAMLLKKQGVIGEASQLTSNITKLAVVGALIAGTYLYFKAKKKLS
jgi:hypothetical protein